MRILFFLLFSCSIASADMWVLSSAKKQQSIVTKNQERTVQWCNEFYQTNDCVKADVQEPTEQDLLLDEQKMILQVQINDLAQKITNAIADDDMTLVTTLRTQRNALKQQLQGLEN